MNESRIDALLELGARVGYRGGAEAVERLRAAMQKLDANELGAEILARLWTVRYALMISGAELPPVPEGGESGVAGARVEELRALAALRSGDELAALTSFDRARELGGDDREFLAELELDRCTWLSPLLRPGLGEEFERQLAELERRPVGDATLWRARVALARGRLAVLRGELERASSEPPASEAPGGSYRGALGPVESELDRAARLFTDLAQLSGRGWARWWQLLRGRAEAAEDSLRDFR